MTPIVSSVLHTFINRIVCLNQAETETDLLLFPLMQLTWSSPQQQVFQNPPKDSPQDFDVLLLTTKSSLLVISATYGDHDLCLVTKWIEDCKSF